MTDSECTGRGHCSNNVRDVDESNVDCGGAYCNACPSIPSPSTPVVNIFQDLMMRLMLHLKIIAVLH